MRDSRDLTRRAAGDGREYQMTSATSPTSGLPVILEELTKSLLPGSFQRIADLSVSSRRKLHRAQPLVQQLVFFRSK
jgi:hypothetical protein